MKRKPGAPRGAKRAERGSGEADEQLQTWVPSGMKQAVKTAADREGITASEWVRRLIRKALGK